VLDRMVAAPFEPPVPAPAESMEMVTTHECAGAVSFLVSCRAGTMRDSPKCRERDL